MTEKIWTVVTNGGKASPIKDVEKQPSQSNLAIAESESSSPLRFAIVAKVQKEADTEEGKITNFEDGIVSSEEEDLPTHKAKLKNGAASREKKKAECNHERT